MKIGHNENLDLLPVEYEQGTPQCPFNGGCSLVGDIRADENIALHSMHTIWVREHNRIAKILKGMNPVWTDQKLYDVARKITSAVWQHIVYQEYIPLLTTLPAYTGYKPNTNPTVSNTFATAAFRYGHSLVPNEFPQLDKGFNHKADPITLQEAFYNRAIIDENGIEPTMFGLVANTSNNVDDGFAHSIARKLFVAVGSDDYLDLTALNIQRGRDHGLPGYNVYRKKCGFAKATWENLDSIMVSGVAAKFRSIYESPDDIDIFAGGISEKHIGSLEVGETFNCVFSQQFGAIRDGDRFYYENAGVFTPPQFQAIKKVTLATILCNNVKGIVSIQPDAFRTPEFNSNTRIVCDSIPKLDLNPWREINSVVPQVPPVKDATSTNNVEGKDLYVVVNSHDDGDALAESKKSITDIHAEIQKKNDAKEVKKPSMTSTTKEDEGSLKNVKMTTKKESLLDEEGEEDAYAISEDNNSKDADEIDMAKAHLFEHVKQNHHHRGNTKKELLQKLEAYLLQDDKVNAALENDIEDQLEKSYDKDLPNKSMEDDEDLI